MDGNIKVAIIKRNIRAGIGTTPIILQEIKLLNTFNIAPVLVSNRITADIVHKLRALNCSIALIRDYFGGTLSNKLFSYRVKRWIAKNKPDIVISHADTASDDIVHIHNCVHLHSERVYGKSINDRDKRLGALHEQILTNRNTKLFIANSQMTKNDMIARHGVDADKIEVIYPELNDDIFNLIEHDLKRAEGRKLLGAGDDEVLIGFVTSGDFAKRNLPFFIDIVEELARRGQKFKALIIGRGNYTEIERTVKERGIEQFFIIKDIVTDIAQIYHALDISLLPAKHEEFGYVVVEAGACGTPCIASDRVGSSELLVDNSMGELVLPIDGVDSLYNWCAQVERLMADSDYREYVSKKIHDISVGYSKISEERYRNILKRFITAIP